MIDIILVLFFFVGIVVFWRFFSSKIPQLVAIPDSVIRERLAEDSARMRLMAVSVGGIFRDQRYLLLILQFAGKLLHKLHIYFLRIDNFVVSLLKRIREKNSTLVENMGGYLKARQEEELEEEEVMPE